MHPAAAHSTATIKAKVTREQQATAELAHTVFSRGVRGLLVAAFLATLAAVPLLQLTGECRQIVRARGAAAGSTGVRRLPQVLDVFTLLPGWEDLKAVRGFGDLVRLLPSVRRIKDYEDALERASVVGQRLLPPVQNALAARLGAGNEQAYLGRDGWLFYRPDVDYVTGPAFLDPRQMRRRALKPGAPQPDPRKAVLQFHEQLRRRGIQLVLVPTPVKPMLEPEHFASAPPDGVLNNPAFAQFVAEVRAQGVLVYDCAPLLAAAKQATGAPQYLATDTHWSPAAMDQAAAGLARFLQEQGLLGAAAPAGYRRVALPVTNLGDIALMLRLPADQTVFRLQTVTVQQVLQSGGAFWRPSAVADVLLLGDSFSNIYSLGPMGWGEGGGFAEQLSYNLQQPVDALLRNADGAYATRGMLAGELARGRDRLAGKRCVVWQFAVRELASGDWKPVELRLGTPPPATFYVPPAGASQVVSGVVETASSVPRPGSVPYKDHIFAVQLRDLSAAAGPLSGRAAVVYLWSMRDGVLTPAAQWRAGDPVVLTLRPWSEVAERYGAFNRSEPDDADVLLQEPCWGEPSLSPKAAGRPR